MTGALVGVSFGPVFVALVAVGHRRGWWVRFGGWLDAVADAVAIAVDDLLAAAPVASGTADTPALSDEDRRFLRRANECLHSAQLRWEIEPADPYIGHMIRTAGAYLVGVYNGTPFVPLDFDQDAYDAWWAARDAAPSGTAPEGDVSVHHDRAPHVFVSGMLDGPEFCAICRCVETAAWHLAAPVEGPASGTSVLDLGNGDAVLIPAEPLIDVEGPASTDGETR